MNVVIRPKVRVNPYPMALTTVGKASDEYEISAAKMMLLTHLMKQTIKIRRVIC